MPAGVSSHVRQVDNVQRYQSVVGYVGQNEIGTYVTKTREDKVTIDYDSDSDSEQTEQRMQGLSLRGARAAEPSAPLNAAPSTSILGTTRRERQ